MSDLERGAPVSDRNAFVPGRRAGAAIAAGAFLRRDLAVAVSYPVPFLLELVSIVFIVVTYVFVGRLVEPGRVPGGYFAFATLGLAVSALLGASSAVGTGVRDEQVQGTLESVVAAGLPIRALAAGMTAYPLVSAAVSAVAYVAVAAVAGFRTGPDPNWALVLAALLLSSVSFVGLGLVGAALVFVIRRGAAATSWLVAILALAGGEFFPPGMLPGWVQGLASLSPFTHGLATVRAALLEGASWSDRAGSLAALAALAVLYLGLGMVALAAGLRYARRTGGLAGY